MRKKIVATEDGVTLTGSDSDIPIESFIPRVEDDDVRSKYQIGGFLNEIYLKPLLGICHPKGLFITKCPRIYR